MTTYYHGTSIQLSVGDEIRPPSETNSLSEKGRKKNLDLVFFTSDPKSARIYAGRAVNSLGGTPHVYTVVPLGEVQTINSTPGTTVYAAKRAIVASEVT